MKNIIIGAALLVFGSCEKNKQISSIKQNVQQESALADKEWQIKSVYTSPAVIDVTGDGNKDNEIISSLQKEDREKTILFSSRGIVVEQYNIEDLLSSEGFISSNGTWWESNAGDSLNWKQSDGRVFRAKVKHVSEKKVELLHSEKGYEVKFVLELNKQ